MALNIRANLVDSEFDNASYTFLDRYPCKFRSKRSTTRSTSIPLLTKSLLINALVNNQRSCCAYAWLKEFASFSLFE